MKTLAYDCGNPVQYVCGHLPAVLFYLLDRHALLAMTMGSKCVFLNSLTTPGCAHPSNGGELGTYRRGEKFPSAEGWHEVPGWSLWSLCPTPSCFACPPPWNHPRKLCLRGARWAVGIICPLHSNKKRGPAPFFLNTVCVYPTAVSQQSRGHAFVAAQGVYDTACLGRVQINNAYFVHVAFLDDDGVAIFHHTGRQ